MKTNKEDNPGAATIRTAMTKESDTNALTLICSDGLEFPLARHETATKRLIFVLFLAASSTAHSTVMSVVREH